MLVFKKETKQHLTLSAGYPFLSESCSESKASSSQSQEGLGWDGTSKSTSGGPAEICLDFACENDKIFSAKKNLSLLLCIFGSIPTISNHPDISQVRAFVAKPQLRAAGGLSSSYGRLNRSYITFGLCWGLFSKGACVCGLIPQQHFPCS